MNTLPHYRATIDGRPIHFVHLRGTGSNTRPLILTHGWPWSFLDWVEAGRRLADPGAYGGDPAQGCDVVIPSRSRRLTRSMQGVVLRPTRRASSVKLIRPSSCSTRRIFRSILLSWVGVMVWLYQRQISC